MVIIDWLGYLDAALPVLNKKPKPLFNKNKPCPFMLIFFLCDLEIEHGKQHVASRTASHFHRHGNLWSQKLVCHVCWRSCGCGNRKPVHYNRLCQNTWPPEAASSLFPYKLSCCWLPCRSICWTAFCLHPGWILQLVEFWIQKHLYHCQHIPWHVCRDFFHCFPRCNCSWKTLCHALSGQIQDNKGHELRCGDLFTVGRLCRNSKH